MNSKQIIILAILRGFTSGYAVPYTVFAAVALIGGLMFLFIHIKVATGNKVQD